MSGLIKLVCTTCTIVVKLYYTGMYVHGTECNHISDISHFIEKPCDVQVGMFTHCVEGETILCSVSNNTKRTFFRAPKNLH